MTWQMPDSISPSRMSTFMQCPLRFRFESIQKVRGKTNAAAVAGTTMHAALEELMRLPGEERTVERLAELVEEALVAIRETDDYQSLDPASLKDFDAKCRRVTPRAFDMIDVQGMNVYSTEQMIEVDLDGWILRGIIDLMEDRPGFGLIVLDYKTGRAPSPKFESKALLGLEFYAVMVKRHLGRMPSGIGLLYLDSRKSIKRVPTEQSVAATERKILAVRSAIQQACDNDRFQPSVSKLCDWCSCKPFCPAHGGDEADAPVTVDIGRA